MPQSGNRVFNIDPPTSSNAIMRRLNTYGENSDPGKDATESLTPRPELENSLSH